MDNDHARGRSFGGHGSAASTAGASFTSSVLHRAGRLFPATTLALACAAGCSARTTVPVLPPAAPQTGVGAGDELEIRVAEHDDLSGTFQVASNGELDFPYVGRLDVAGKSPVEVAEALERRLADGYLQDPQVTVRVVSRQNREVKVLGNVKSPGSFPYKERLTLLQAISLAGGLDELAMPRRVKLIRDTIEGRVSVEVDVRGILNGRTPDIPLEPGDTIFVPESPI